MASSEAERLRPMDPGRKAVTLREGDSDEDAVIDGDGAEVDTDAAAGVDELAATAMTAGDMIGSGSGFGTISLWVGRIAENGEGRAPEVGVRAGGTGVFLLVVFLPLADLVDALPAEVLAVAGDVAIVEAVKIGVGSGAATTTAPTDAAPVAVSFAECSSVN